MKRKNPASKTGARRGSRKAPPTNAWPKGQSGNPEGRPKTDPELVEAFRGRTMKALSTLDKVMSDFERNALTEKGDPLIPPVAAVKAAEVVLNRGWGTAPSTIKLDAKLDASVKDEVRTTTKVVVDTEKLAKVVALLAQANALPQLRAALGPTPERDEAKEESHEG